MLVSNRRVIIARMCDYSEKTGCLWGVDVWNVANTRLIVINCMIAFPPPTLGDCVYVPNIITYNCPLLTLSYPVLHPSLPGSATLRVWILDYRGDVYYIVLCCVTLCYIVLCCIMLHCSCLRHNEITAVRPNECPQLPGGELLKFAAILHFSFSFQTETREFNISFWKKCFLASNIEMWKIKWNIYREEYFI